MQDLNKYPVPTIFFSDLNKKESSIFEKAISSLNSPENFKDNADIILSLATTKPSLLTIENINSSMDIRSEKFSSIIKELKDANLLTQNRLNSLYNFYENANETNKEYYLSFLKAFNINTIENILEYSEFLNSNNNFKLIERNLICLADTERKSLANLIINKISSDNFEDIINSFWYLKCTDDSSPDPQECFNFYNLNPHNLRSILNADDPIAIAMNILDPDKIDLQIKIIIAEYDANKSWFWKIFPWEPAAIKVLRSDQTKESIDKFVSTHNFSFNDSLNYAKEQLEALTLRQKSQNPRIKLFKLLQKNNLLSSELITTLRSFDNCDDFNSLNNLVSAIELKLNDKNTAFKVDQAYLKMFFKKSSTAKVIGSLNAKNASIVSNTLEKYAAEEQTTGTKNNYMATSPAPLAPEHAEASPSEHTTTAYSS